MIRSQNDLRCPLCDSVEQTYLFEIDGHVVRSCLGCSLTFLSKFESKDSNHFFSIESNSSQRYTPSLGGMTDTEASKRYVQHLVGRRSDIREILLVAEPGHCFVDVATASGLNVVKQVTWHEIENDIQLPSLVDAVVVIYQLEKIEGINKVLGRIYQILREEGELLATTLSLDSLPARFFGQDWIGWRTENKYYFDNNTLQSLLLKYGFEGIELKKDARLYTFEHIYDRAVSFPKTWLTRSIILLFGILPNSLHRVSFRLPSSGMIVMARKRELRKKPLLSIVMPVYNESSTFSVIAQQLLDKKIDGVDTEIIIVESNSSDNSRELVLQHQNNPIVKILLQEKALGKGNAVRAGLEAASGDVILIQDADLEYDINDYEALLEPILSYKKAFVLGARHGGRWKMRHFNDQKQLSAYFNFGHVLFTFLINLMYGQRMKDPFTMFKVFRRDCLYNLVFECNRFDFDFELVIKLIRKGYIPLEIPVNYVSRSFAEGKKVQMFRDPLTWIWALVKYRFVKITKE